MRRKRIKKYINYVWLVLVASSFKELANSDGTILKTLLEFGNFTIPGCLVCWLIVNEVGSKGCICLVVHLLRVLCISKEF